MEEQRVVQVLGGGAGQPHPRGVAANTLYRHHSNGVLHPRPSRRYQLLQDGRAFL